MPSSPPSFRSSAASLLVLSARHGTAGHVEPVLVQGDGWGCATEIARLTQDRQSRSAFHRQRVGWSGVAAAPTLSFALVAASARSTGNPRENRTDLQASEPHPGWFPRGPQRPPRLGKGKRGDGENTLPRLSRHRTPEPQTAWKSRGRTRGPAVTGVSQARLIAPLPPPPAHGNTLGRGEQVSNLAMIPLVELVAEAAVGNIWLRESSFHEMILASLTGHCPPPRPARRRPRDLAGAQITICCRAHDTAPVQAVRVAYFEDRRDRRRPFRASDGLGGVLDRGRPAHTDSF